jgi:hypothetical protein
MPRMIVFVENSGDPYSYAAGHAVAADARNANDAGTTPLSTNAGGKKGTRTSQPSCAQDAQDHLAAQQSAVRKMPVLRIHKR